MTVFDDRLFATLESLADEDDRVQISMRQLADILDVSTRSVRESEKRLTADGRIIVSHNENPALPSVIRLADHADHAPDHERSQRDLTGGLGSRQPHLGAGRAASPLPLVPTGSADHDRDREPKAPPRDPNPTCPMCEGTGWVELPDGTNTVEPCRCLSAEYRAFYRDRRRSFARTWPVDTIKEQDRPAKPDMNALMLELNRRNLHRITDAKKANRATEDLELPPQIINLRLVIDVNSDDPDGT